MDLEKGDIQWLTVIIMSALQIVVPIVWQIAWPSLRRKMKRLRQKRKPPIKRRRRRKR